ncbi:MAG: class I SAM-dependent methyltransferase [Acidobacteriota bacterium]
MNQNIVEPIIDLGSIPFHVGESKTPSNIDLPDVLPFVVGINEDTGVIMQMPNQEVQHYLDLAYRRGSIIGTPLSPSGIGRRYADDFFGFILRAIPAEAWRGLRVLEIGCGNGYLLSRLKELGAEVLGIEPGRQGEIGAETYGVEIIRDLFPSKRVSTNERFDVILTYAVAEHVIDPAHFFQLQLRQLSESGCLIFSVPDCIDCISTGDISMFIHEHWSYFSPNSLSELVRSTGLRLLRFENSGYGGALYAVAGKEGDMVNIGSAGDESALFKGAVEKSIEHARAFFRQAADANSSVGIFCAIRAINLLHVLGVRNNIRFFDDDARLHGKYYPPFDFPIESRSSFLTDPVDELIIMSRSFGSKIKHKLQNEKQLGSTSILLVDEFLRNR